MLSERSSAKLALSGSATDFGGEVTGAVDYRNAALSAGASYRVTESDSAGLQLARSQYRAASLGTRSDSSSLSLSWQHAMTERSSAALSVGAYRTVSQSPHPVLVCPLPISFCSGGLVGYIVALRQGETIGSGTQFDASLDHQASPTTGLTFAASRQISPSGAGSVTRNDALSIGARSAWSETLSGTASASLSRSSFIDAAGAAQPRLRVLSLGLTKALGPDLSLDASLRHTRSDDPRSGLGATANAIALTLRIQRPRRFAWH
jgi:hypothetical protein